MSLRDAVSSFWDPPAHWPRKDLTLADECGISEHRNCLALPKKRGGSELDKTRNSIYSGSIREDGNLRIVQSVRPFCTKVHLCLNSTQVPQQPVREGIRNYSTAALH